MKLRIVFVMILSALLLTGCQNKVSVHEQHAQTERRNKEISTN